MLRRVSAGLTPGASVGPYTVLFPLGKGGMGEVWAASRLARDGELGPMVALKLLLRERADENDVLMFFDEAKAASVLHHDAIVPTVDLGRDGETLYIAMELVRGPSMTALLQRLVIAEDSLPPAVVAYLGVQLARALDYAHNRAHHHGQPLRLVHRDVSPHNVLVDLQGSVRLTDFGVARTAIQDHRSRVGTVRGKPSYMAPEQVTGSAIDGRTDLFALGIVLYECSCLRRLFGRKNPVKSMDAVLKYQPRPLTELVPTFPPQLADIIGTLLRKRPSERPGSAGEVVRMLESCAGTIAGYRQAPEWLSQALQRHFESGAFDVEHRARAALAELAPVEDPTRIHTPDEAPPDEPATTIWPSAAAPDPLAPEAIEELRTRLQMRREAPHPKVIPARVRFEASAPSYPVVERKVWPWMAAVVGVAVAGVVGVRLGGELERTPIPAGAAEPASAPRPPEAPRAEAVVRAEPVARTAPRTEPVLPAARPTSREAETPEPARSVVPKRASRRSAGRASRSESEPAPVPDEGDATYKEVQRLIAQVRKKDGDAGRQMLLTLLEAGETNVEVLNTLRRRARKILAP